MADLVAGDTVSKFVVTCKKKSDGTVIDLTGYTAQLIFHVEKDGVHNRTIAQAMAIPTPVSGIVEYQFVAGELVEGDLKADVRLTDPGGKFSTGLKKIERVVRERVTN